MKLKLIAYGIVGAFTISVANADNHGKDVVEAAVAPGNEIGATLSAGYMSSYVFYGLELAEHGVWTGVDYTVDILPVAVDVGAWYINGADGSGYDELDLYASVAGPSLAGFDSSISFIAYLFPSTSADATYEVNLAVSRSLGFADVAASAHYDFELEAWYFETGLSKGFAVTDSLEVVVGAGISYAIDYYSPGSDWNHVYVQAELPIALTDTATLTPYIAGLFALDAIEDIQDDIVHGGVSLSVTF